MGRLSDLSEVAIACTEETIGILMLGRELTDAIRAHYAPAGYRVAEVIGYIDDAARALQAGDGAAAYGCLLQAARRAELAYDDLAEADTRYGDGVTEFERRRTRKRRLNSLMCAGIPFAAAEDLVA
jgi:hypothetical protein